MSRKKFRPKIITLESPLLVERLTPTGQGIATAADGMKIFLWNALPGEEVSEFEMTKKKSHYTEGIATKISKTSPDRIEPKDAHFLSTSPWQIMTTDAEIAAKKSLLTELYFSVFENQKEKISSSILSSDLKITASENDYFYRNKMEYALYFDNDDQKIHLAVHARGSHRKIKIESSSIERPEIFAQALKIIDGLNSRHEEARKYQSLLLRANQAGEVSGGLFENGKPHPVFENLTDRLLGFEYSYSPNGFFQINLPVYEKALIRIKELIENSNTKDILDLYSGVGTIGLSVARDKNLTLVEVDKSAFNELENNVRVARAENEKLGIETQINPVLAKSEEALDFITADSVVILDPPRAGCDEKLIEKLLEVRPKQIIYLSCNPATQARDVAKLLKKYQLDSLEAFNFFPRTPHIEALVNLV